MPQTSLSEPLHRLMHAYKSGMRQAVHNEQIALPITHIRALKGVCFMPECTVQAIAHRMQRDKAQITRVVNELHTDGLIIKIDNPNDRRSQLLRPTPQGKQTMQRIQTLEEQTAAHMTGNLSQTDIDTFVRLANTLADNMSDHNAKRANALEGDANDA